jgi:phosphatidylglycerophosphate synthase
MPKIETHTRVNDMFFGPLERPALRWLAAHSPAWLTPDILTGIGFSGSLMTAAAYGLTYFDRNFLWLASLGFVVNWYGDSLDGTLARYRRIERPRYGFYIEHVVDAFSEVLIFLGLGLSPYVRFDLASLALVGYLLLSILVYIRTCVRGEFVIAYGKLGPTEVRLIAIGANTLVYFIGNPHIPLPFGALTVYDLIVAAITVLLYTIFISSAIHQGILLAGEEPGGQPPSASPSGK